MSKYYKVTLTRDERDELLQIVKKGTHQSQKIRKALILLNCDEGEFADKLTNEEISKILKVGMRTIDRVKKRFVEEGIDVVLTGKPTKRKYLKKVDGEIEAHLVALSCGKPPEGFSRWSLRLLANKMVELKYVDSISHETVRQVLKKTN
jgi:transposase